MATENQINTFLQTAAPIAKDIEKRYGIPYQFALAQSSLESSFGTHAPGNMYFGVKAPGDWKGQTQLLWTTEYIDGKPQKMQQVFKAFPNMAASFEDWARLLTGLKRYAPAFKVKDDVMKFATAIVKAGYATDINYVPKIQNMVNILKKKGI
jgi:flagellar protein FlgJ